MGLITEESKPGRTSGSGLGRSTRHERVDDEAPPYSSEITLGMRSMLGIFFGLVLVCGVFFGLGYSVGRNGGLRPASDETASSPALGDSSLKKPSATEQGLTPVPAPAAPANADQNKAAQNNNSLTETDLGSNPASDQAAKPAPAAAQPAAATPQPAKPAPQPVTQKAALTPAPAPVAKPAGSFSNPYRPATPPPTTQSYTQNSASPAAGGFMVQIAAVRQPQDASVLVSALQQHGFHAEIRHEAQDQLLHIQLGPFATRAQAFEMRSKLLANGYNAVVK